MIDKGTLSPQLMRGFTMAEVLIAVAVLAVLGTIVYPVMSGYMISARQGTLRTNIESIRLAQEEFKLSRHAFISGTYDPDDPDNANGLKARIGWSPNTTKDSITYVVTCGVVSTAPRCTIQDGFYVTATDADFPEYPACVAYGGASCP